MYVTKWQTDEGLWKSALTLVKGQHYADAIEVMKAIAVQTVQSIGGSISFRDFPTPQKQIGEKEVLYMQSLSKEIAQLAEQRKKDQVVELTTEYLDRFVHLFSDTEGEANALHKQLLKGFIEHKLDGLSEIHYKVVESDGVYASSILSRLAAESEKVEYVTSSEAAEIGGVSDQTIRRWCEKGKFPNAFKTSGGHWRIPQQHFKMTLQETRKAEGFMKEEDVDTSEQFGGKVDEFDLDLDYS